MGERRCPQCEAVMELSDECHECQIFMSKGGAVNVNHGLEPLVLKDECSKGHTYTPENTIMQRQREKYRRVCRECQRAYYHSYWNRSGSEVRKLRYAKRKQEQGRQI
jgi:hypothetical protein